jgi:hypothetical protein
MTMKRLLLATAAMLAMLASSSAMEVGSVVSFPPDRAPQFRQIGCIDLNDAIAVQRRHNVRTPTCKVISGHPDLPADLKWKVVDKTRTQYTGPRDAYFCLEPVGYDAPCYWLFLEDR